MLSLGAVFTAACFLRSGPASVSWAADLHPQRQHVDVRPAFVTDHRRSGGRNPGLFVLSDQIPCYGGRCVLGKCTPVSKKRDR